MSEKYRVQLTFEVQLSVDVEIPKTVKVGRKSVPTVEDGGTGPLTEAGQQLVDDHYDAKREQLYVALQDALGPLGFDAEILSEEPFVM